MKFPLFANRSKKVKIKKRFNYKTALVFVAVFVGIGAIAMLYRSFAATALVLDTTLPAPANVKAYGDDQNIIVTWDKVNNNRVVGYYITYRPKGSSGEYKVRQTIHSRIQLQPLVNNQEYEISVQSASGTVLRTSVGNLVYPGGQNNWHRGDGRVSNKVTVSGTPSSDRVDAMRSRLTGFFDDFNDPAGPFNEELWNQATTSCIEPGTAAAFLNAQFHTHNQIRSTCDRAGMATRPRATFDMSQVTESNPGQIEMDVDGATHGRDTWYVDVIPTSSRSNGYPIDITSHNDIFDSDNEDPGNMLRINAKFDVLNMAYYNKNRQSTNLDLYTEPTACSQSWQGASTVAHYSCDYSKKTSGISPIPQINVPTDSVQVPNVRNHWVIRITPSKIRVYINGTHIASANTPADFFAEKKYTVQSTIFSYNTGKDTSAEGDRQITPYVQLLHWDNFGFNGPKPQEVIHNYIEGGTTGTTPVFSTSNGGNYSIREGSRSTIIPIPDDIGSLVNNQARLYFTMSVFSSGTYTWDPNDHVKVNGVRYSIPDPGTMVKSPKQIGSCDQFVSSTVPFAMAIPVNKADLRKGNNTIEFNAPGRSNSCAGRQASFLNAHIELPYSASDQNIPAYTQPLQIFGQSMREITEPALTNCDYYRYIEQDLGLPYESGKANISVGPCTIMDGHNSSSGTHPEPPTTPTNQRPTITLTSSTTSTTAPANYSLVATASDTDGSITKIEIRNGSSIVRTCSSSPCTYNASGIAPGNYSYSAIATDNSSATTTSSVTNITVTEPTPPPSTNFFDTLPVNATLPSETECASRVKPRTEIRSSNAIPNSTKGVGGNYNNSRVTGNYTGTTDEIIQWGACKWGINEDILRAQMSIESGWFQSAIGDFSADGNACSTLYPVRTYPPQYNGDADHVNQCPESYGLSQVRWTYHKSAFYTSNSETPANLTNNAIYSTAYNVDYYGSVWRSCYNGDLSWLNTVERGRDYNSGDVWGCLGVWFSGRWYTDPANEYIAAVQDRLDTKAWTQSWFLNSQPTNTIPTSTNPTPPADSTAPTVSITAPSNNATVNGTVTVSANASDNEAVTRVSFFLDGSPTAFSNDSSAPYSASWNSANVANGTHTLKATAIDLAGNIGSSTTITITVNNVVPDTTAPTTAINSPSNNATVRDTITVDTTASDNIGVSRVQLIIDGQVTATDTTSPYRFSINTIILSEGAHELRTRAYDATGNNTYSAIVRINVDNIPDPPQNCVDTKANNTGQPLPCTYDTAPPTPSPVVNGDITGDGVVDRKDLRQLIINYGKNVTTNTGGDVNGDGVVDRKDLRILIINYGKQVEN